MVLTNWFNNFQDPVSVAYLRVFTIDQNLEINKADILHLANDKNLKNVEFVEEKHRESILETKEDHPTFRRT